MPQITLSSPSAPEAKRTYMKLLLRDMHALERLLSSNTIERGVTRIGAELEMNIVDKNSDPLKIGDELHKSLADDSFTTEFARFNLELNAEPLELSGNCFSQLATAFTEKLSNATDEANKRDADILLTGIIPSLNGSHIGPDALTPKPRYKALYDLRRELKGEQYQYNIRGVDELITKDNISLFAGSITSYQAHLQVDLEDFVEMFNWAQLLSAPLLAASCYSPIFLGRRLWHETRVALFEQAADTRNPDTNLARLRPRVFFGDNWLEGSILKMFQEDIANFEPLFTIEEAEDPNAAFGKEQSPRFEAWDAFNSSIYRWNRVCYGRLNGKPSFRIENRILPSGPTVDDMVANQAFWVGAMRGLSDRYRDLPRKMDFSQVKENFFTAARLGLGVSLHWLDGKTITAESLLLDELIPLAREGLARSGVSKEDIKKYLGIFEERVRSGNTGSRWMIDSYSRLLKQGNREDALTALTKGMLQRQKSNQPVHTWDLVDIAETGKWNERYSSIRKIMTTDLYKVGKDDIVDLAVHIMEWKHIGHIPVEDENGHFVGIINKDTIINYMTSSNEPVDAVRVSDIMIENPVTVSPSTELNVAINLIQDKQLSCLPIVADQHIVGIVTERDFVRVTRELLQERSTEMAC